MATAAELRRDVSIVISPKDRFGTTAEHLAKVREFAPGVRILHVLCGPMAAGIRRHLEQQAERDPDLSLLDTQAAFANPYQMRNRALAQVRTKYVVFLFNDVVPLNERWLATLYRAAETHPEADLFQPFIWEGIGAPHATWIGLWFLRHRGELHCLHPNGAEERVPDPAALPEKEQPFFVEDHAFFARTEFLSRQSILDPGAAYTREYLDMALSMRFRGARTWSVPSSQVLYRVPYEMQPGDLAYFCHRRSWAVSRGSIEYIQKKWGFRYWDDAYSRTFTDTQLASANWTGAAIPDDRLTQVEMMLGLFVAAGYDCFDVLRAGTARGQAMMLLPAAHRLLADALRAGDHEIAWEMRHLNAVGILPDFADDFAARRQALQDGKLFPIVEDAAATAALEARGPGRVPMRFALLEIEGLHGDESGLLAALAPHASLIVRERDESAQVACRAWLHVLVPPQTQLTELETICANGALRWAGTFLAGARARLHLSHDRGAHAARIQVQPAATGWRLLHCAWKPTLAADAAALFR